MRVHAGGGVGGAQAQAGNQGAVGKGLSALLRSSDSVLRCGCPFHQGSSLTQLACSSRAAERLAAGEQQGGSPTHGGGGGGLSQVWACGGKQRSVRCRTPGSRGWWAELPSTTTEAESAGAGSGLESSRCLGGNSVQRPGQFC